MRHLAILSGVLIALTACQSGSPDGVTSVPGHGAVAIQIVPNPIVATSVSGKTYEFPFEVVVRETGGRPVNVTRVSATVVAPGGITLARESWDAERIRSMGYSTSLNPFGEARYRFTPRREVPDERLFGGVAAELKLDAVDDTGQVASATTRVTITR